MMDIKWYDEKRKKNITALGLFGIVWPMLI
jgi:hypothetical protein